MSFRAYYELNCDDGCGTAYRAPVDTLHSSLAMQAAAIADGWQASTAAKRGARLTHRCPDCAAKRAATEGRRLPPVVAAPEVIGERRDHTVYGVGLCYASACTSLDNEAATRRMPPSGTTGGWQVAEDPTFADGIPNGAPCPDAPETHRHLLFAC